MTGENTAGNEKNLGDAATGTGTVTERKRILRKEISKEKTHIRLQEHEKED